jgi:hypothetical protein
MQLLCIENDYFNKYSILFSILTVITLINIKLIRYILNL